MQTKLGKDANCLAACMASLLEMPIELFEIPNTTDGWMREIDEALKPYGWTYLEFDPQKIFSWCGECYMIGCGKSERGRMHAVIVRHFVKDQTHHYEFVHDPHPGGGFVELQSVGLIIPTWANTRRNKYEA